MIRDLNQRTAWFPLCKFFSLHEIIIKLTQLTAFKWLKFEKLKRKWDSNKNETICHGNISIFLCIPSLHKARRYKESGSPKFPSSCKTLVPPSKFLRARKCRIASRTTQYLVKHSTSSLKIEVESYICFRSNKRHQIQQEERWFKIINSIIRNWIGTSSIWRYNMYFIHKMKNNVVSTRKKLIWCRNQY